jgi:hypothetical protein
MTANNDRPPTLSVSFRGTKLDIIVEDYEMTVRNVQEAILRKASVDIDTPLKLLCQGKQLLNLDATMRASLESISKKSHYKILATGVSLKEVQTFDEQLAKARTTVRIRDDLTDQGQKELEEKKRLGQYMLYKANQKGNADSSPYRFGRIDILPNLPNQEKAREILTSLSNDPGILACLQSHQWKVGALAELYPEGKVGQSDVCVMGLNENKGQRILLRIRTDDLKGFRKMSSIRKVLYHELAHNVHSEHDDQFFQLMRLVERECTSMDWTNGAGLSSVPAMPGTLYSGGTYRLGGSSDLEHCQQPLRELAAQAALSRMTEEEHDIEQNCGCGQKDLFLPKVHNQNETLDSKDQESYQMNTDTC